MAEERAIARVSITNISRRFGDLVAVKNFSMIVQDTEFAAILGPSGCGKTTILRMISGLEDLSSGAIQIGDRVVNDLPPEDRGIAMVSSNYVLFPYMDAYSNMAFGLDNLKVPETEIRRRIDKAAEILGIRKILDRKPRQLSAEQKKRIVFGKAITRKPEVFLMDDPLSDLAREPRRKMTEVIKKIHETLKATIIYVTEHHTEVKTMADRTVIFKDGRFG